MSKKPETTTTAVLDKCLCDGCKVKSTQFGFCSEHFDQYKFGVVRKDGSPAADYDKKIDHYMAYKAKRSGSVRKVA